MFVKVKCKVIYYFQVKMQYNTFYLIINLFINIKHSEYLIFNKYYITKNI